MHNDTEDRQTWAQVLILTFHVWVILNQLSQFSILSLKPPQSDVGRSQEDTFVPKDITVLGPWQEVVNVRCPESIRSIDEKLTFRMAKQHANVTHPGLGGCRHQKPQQRGGYWAILSNGNQIILRVKVEKMILEQSCF